MATYTLTSSRLIDGTVVYATPLNYHDEPATGTVASGSVTFEDLRELEEYVARGTVLGRPVEERFTTPADSGGGAAAPAAADAVRYASGSGDNTNDGLSAGSAKRTLQAAYADLPSTGGTIYVAPGRYDTAAGWNLTRGKPVALIGTVAPPPYIVSTTQAPLTHNCAIIYTSTGAASMIQTTAGTAGANFDGCRFENLLFEFSDPSTTVGIDANTLRYGTVTGCYFFADKTTGPAAPGAMGMHVRGTAGYGDSDCSWWRVNNNRCMNMALGTFGNPTGTKYNCNQMVIRENVGLGLSRLNTTTALPFISIYGGHRNVVRDNNFEAYHRGLLMDTCWMCVEDSDGGEYVTIMVDLVNTKGCRISPLGISYAPLGSTTPNVSGALLVQGDTFTKACVIILPSTWTDDNTQRLYEATDGAAPSISLGSSDNVVITSRNSADQGVRWLKGTGTPESNVKGSVGDFYSRTNGGATTTLYVKESGSATTTGWVAYGAPGPAIPTQTGNSGKYLTTDGTNPLWAALPSGLVIRKTSDETVNNSTTLQSDDELLFALAATEAVFVEAFLLLTSVNTTGDVKLGWSVPAGASMNWGGHGVAGSAVSGYGAQSTGTSPGVMLGAAGTLSVGLGNGQVGVSLAGIVVGGGTAGNVVLQWAQATADANNLIMKTNSILRLGRIS